MVFWSHLNLLEGQFVNEILSLVACSVLSSSIYGSCIMYHYLFFFRSGLYGVLPNPPQVEVQFSGKKVLSLVYNNVTGPTSIHFISTMSVAEIQLVRLGLIIIKKHNNTNNNNNLGYLDMSFTSRQVRFSFFLLLCNYK